MFVMEVGLVGGAEDGCGVGQRGSDGNVCIQLHFFSRTTKNAAHLDGAGKQLVRQVKLGLGKLGVAQLTVKLTVEWGGSRSAGVG